MAKIIYGVALSVITPLLRHYHNIIISLSVWIFLIIILIKLLKRFSVGFTRDFRNTYFKNSLKGCFSNTAQKIKFSIKNFFGKSDQVIFNEKILNGNISFCEVQLELDIHCSLVSSYKSMILRNFLSFKKREILVKMYNDISFE